eukprot:gene51909-70754_t
MPLLAVQLLWLNLVTNGIQDVALAAEKAEGDELDLPPIRPGGPLFDAMMVRRIAFSAIIMGAGGFALFYWLVRSGVPLSEARNDLLLLFVLFENALTLSARSERNPLLRKGFFSNPLLLAGVAATQLVHFGAMYAPGLSETLSVQPVSLQAGGMLMIPALGLLA